MKNIVIIAEQSLQASVLATLDDLDVQHFTIFEVLGKGEHTSPETAYSKNIRIESIVSAHLMDEILERFQREHFGNKAIIIFVQDVEVVRHQKFL